MSTAEGIFRELQRGKESDCNGHQNGKVGDTARDGVTGAYGVLKANESDKHLVDMCRGRGLITRKTWGKNGAWH